MKHESNGMVGPNDEAFELSHFLNDTPRGVLTPPASNANGTPNFGRGILNKNLNKTFSTIAKAGEYESRFKSPYTPIGGALFRPANDSFAFTTPVSWERGSKDIGNLNSTGITEVLSPSSELLLPSGFQSKRMAVPPQKQSFPSALIMPVCSRRVLSKLRLLRLTAHRLAFAYHIWIVKSYMKFFKRLRVYRRMKMNASRCASVMNISAVSRFSDYKKTTPILASTANSFVTTARASDLDFTGHSIHKHANEMTRVNSITRLSLQETIMMPVATCIKVLACTQAWIRNWEHRYRVGSGKWDRSPAMAMYDNVQSSRLAHSLHPGTDTWLHERVTTMLKFNAAFSYFQAWCTYAGFSMHAKHFFTSVGLRRGYSALFLNVYKKKKKPWTRADLARYQCMIGKFRAKFKKWKRLVYRHLYERRFDHLLPKKRLLKQMKEFVDIQSHRRYMCTVGDSQYCDLMTVKAVKKWNSYRKNKVEESEQTEFLRLFALRSALRRLDKRTRAIRRINILLRKRKREIWSLWRRHYYHQQQKIDCIVNVRYKTLLKAIHWRAWQYALRGKHAERHVLTIRSRQMLRFWRLWIDKEKLGIVAYASLGIKYRSSPCCVRAIHMLMHPSLARCFDALRQHKNSFESEESARRAYAQWARVALSRYLVRWYRRTLYTIETYMSPAIRALYTRLIRHDNNALALNSQRRTTDCRDKATRRRLIADVICARKRYMAYKGAQLGSSEGDLGDGSVESVRRGSLHSVLLKIYLKRLRVRSSRIFLFSSLEDGIKAMLRGSGILISRNGPELRGINSKSLVKNHALRSKNVFSGEKIHRTDIVRLCTSRSDLEACSSPFVMSGISQIQHVPGPENIIFAFVACGDRSQSDKRGNKTTMFHVKLDQITQQNISENYGECQSLSYLLHSRRKRHIVSYLRALRGLVSSNGQLRQELLMKYCRYADACRMGRTSHQSKAHSSIRTNGQIATVAVERPGAALMLLRWFNRLFLKACRKAHLRKHLLTRLKPRYQAEKRAVFKKLIRNVHTKKLLQQIALGRKTYIFFSIKSAFIEHKHRKYLMQRVLLHMHARVQRARISLVVRNIQLYLLRSYFSHWKCDYDIAVHAAIFIEEASRRHARLRHFNAWREELVVHRGRRNTYYYTLRRMFNSLKTNAAGSVKHRKFKKRRYLRQWFRRIKEYKDLMRRSTDYSSKRALAKSFFILASRASVETDGDNLSYLLRRVASLSAEEPTSALRDSSRSKVTLRDVESAELCRLATYLDQHKALGHFSGRQHNAVAEAKEHFDRSYGNQLRGERGEDMQNQAHRQRRSVVAQVLYRLVNIDIGFTGLFLWRNLQVRIKEKRRRESLDRGLIRLRSQTDMLRGLRLVNDVARQYSDEIKQRRAIKTWRKRMKLKSKFSNDADRGHAFYFFNKCAVAMILWYSVSKPQII